MRFIGIVFCAFAASGANSQTIVDACERVASYQFGLAEVHSFDVQAFPELTPPRVQMRLRGRAASAGAISDALAQEIARREAVRSGETPPDEIGLVRCEFENNAPPFGLSAFRCAGIACLGGISDERLEELQVLLQRAYPH